MKKILPTRRIFNSVSLSFISQFLVINFSFLIVAAQVPSTWNSVGIGGGGALFNPSINPGNTSEFYVACDMSAYYHSTDFGLSYSITDFHAIQSGANGVIRFTNNSSILYAIDDSGDYALPVKSTDGGATWSLLPGNPDPSEWTYYLYANYDNSSQMIMSYYNQLYITNNGGTSFTLIHTANNSGSGIVIGGVFFDGSNIYIGTNDGLFVSANSGTSFTLDNSTGLPTGKGIYSFAGAKSGTTTRFFVLLGTSGSIYAGMPGYDYYQLVKGVYSMDYGSGNWVQKQTGISLSVDFLMEVGMAENDINTCYLAGSNTTGYPNVMKTTNAGSNWSHVFNAQGNMSISTGWQGTGGDRDWGYGEVFFGFAVARNDATKILCTDFGFVHKSSDGGATWQQAYLNAADQNAPNVNIVKGRNYHGIGLENTTCWQVFWVDQNNLIAGFSDIYGVRSNDAGSSWNMNYTGLNQNSTYRIVKNPSNGYLYAALSTIHDMYQSTRLQDAQLDVSSSGKIVYSTDNGLTWLLLHDFSHPVFWIALDPNNSNTIYASVINHGSNLGGIYKCINLQNNSTSTWTQLAAPPRTEGHPATVICLNDGKVLCTYSGRRDAAGNFTASSGVFLYNGSTWSDLSVNNNMYYWCKDIVVDPNDATQNTWYVGVFKGWGSTTVNNAGGGLWKTTDRGINWTRITSLDRVTSCTFDPNDANRIYMTTETKGLWTCANVNDVTPVFSQVTSFPFRQPERVYFNPYNANEIWVTTFGNGMRVGTITGCTLPTVSISAGGATTVCKPDVVTLNSTTTGSVTSYQWKKGGTNQSGATNSSYTATKTGTYSVTVTNACGTATSNSISVTVNAKPAATISPGGTVNMCAGQTTTLTANSGNNLSYQWKKGSANISGATNLTYGATAAGKYKVTETNTATGCTKTSAATTVNITCKEELAVGPAVQRDQFSIFPNPSIDEFIIRFGDDSEFNLRITDLLGRTVKEFQNVKGELIFGKEFHEGVYFVEVKAEGQTFVRKIVKE
ncbi:MAG TPA: T9SS type A sorting domain-containing protein [Chitinophagales bacterium]|nr:T9SS type A sorting domain-containing protein [Chitinophagales bacterium]